MLSPLRMIQNTGKNNWCAESFFSISTILPKLEHIGTHGKRKNWTFKLSKLDVANPNSIA